MEDEFLCRDSDGMIDTGMTERCHGCDAEGYVFQHRVGGDVFIDCPNCGFTLRENGEVSEKLICCHCGEVVDDSGEGDGADADADADAKQGERTVECRECDRLAHRGCAEEHYHDCIDLDEDYLCDPCLINDHLECDQCGLIHDQDCIVPMGSGGHDVFGNICKSCFYDDSEEFEAAIQRLGLAEILEREEGREYFRRAMANPDVSVCCTHLIDANSDDKAFEILERILGEQRLRAAVTGYYGKPQGTEAVCFTEMTIRGLVAHASNYSPFGVAFTKGFVFQNGGAPALYVHSDLMRRLGRNAFAEPVRPFINKIDIDGYDYHHEREWRVPHDMEFAYGEIAVVYAPSKYHPQLRDAFPKLDLILDLHLMALLG